MRKLNILHWAALFPFATGMQAMSLADADMQRLPVQSVTSMTENGDEYAEMVELVTRARSVNVPPMGQAETALLTQAIERAEAAEAGDADVDEILSELQAAVAQAQIWIMAYQKAKVPLVAALQRFESDYNAGRQGALRLMSDEAWHRLLDAVVAAAEAKDVTDDYSGFAGAASALNEVLDATDRSIQIYALYERLITSLRSLDADGFDAVLTEAERGENKATDAALDAAVTVMDEAFRSVMSQQGEPAVVDGLLGENLDFEAQQGAVDSRFGQVYGQTDWDTSFTGEATEDNLQYTFLQQIPYGETARPAGVTSDHYLYIRSRWLNSSGTAQVLKEAALPTGNYVLSFYLKTALTSAKENLCYYEVDGLRKKVSATGSWRKREVALDIDEPATLNLSFGFVGGDGSNNAELWVDDISLVLNPYPDETGIYEPVEREDGLAVTADRGGLVLHARTEVNYVVYTVDGGTVAAGRLNTGEEQVLHLPSGVYLVNRMKVCVSD
ncbi:MAG: hypothetical protein NC388_03960 [Clostridium sp.]|nr:hypothetical protein [Clostridium sp.]